MDMPEVYDIWTGRPTAPDAPRPRLTHYPAPAPQASCRDYAPAPRAAVPSPAILILPGGGYAGQAPHESEPVARWLVGLGIAAYVLDYRVAPERHPAPLLDAKQAMRFIRANAAVDSRRVGVLGFSAGGHLAATLSVETPVPGDDSDDRPDLAVLCYPVISFVEVTESGSMRNLLGPDPDDSARAHMSPELHIDARTPPTFLWHTADDEAVDVNNSLLYGKNLAGHGIPFELHVFPHGKHGLGLGPDDPAVEQWTGLCAQWLVDHDWVTEERRRH